ncbi:hypothetical protein IEQ34_021971 [Dendrobium chrysotoxum]|uniref:D-isomer specific 2-hydroxyacid dehydrogenase NAD-binding domain-containing protein n=1 Tax=Dendrobium chrysotoxum TaxID=161865 RepID=A0AAV7FVT9_DENCH|nr:hypothetical protein IEQ34_021971 [Dendrobium chrysotoxum]
MQTRSQYSIYTSGSKMKAGSGGGGGGSPADPNHTPQLPLIISLNCIEDVSFEQQSLTGIASVEHVALSDLTDGRIESAAVVLLHSLAFLPRAAQRRLQSWQLIICLGSSSRVVDSALATDLGLRVVHIDVSRADEIADSVMALLLVLLRRSHLLARHSSASSAVSGWVGSVQQLCRGMRRCRGLVVGIIGKSASARCLVERVVGFRMSVIYFDVLEVCVSSVSSVPSCIDHAFSVMPARALSAMLYFEVLYKLRHAFGVLIVRGDSFVFIANCNASFSYNDTYDTVQILNAECLQHIKPGAIIVNTGSSQLIDDCVLKQLLIDGTIAGCALDGAEGPQWMEAWNSGPRNCYPRLQDQHIVVRTAPVCCPKQLQPAVQILDQGITSQDFKTSTLLSKRLQFVDQNSSSLLSSYKPDAVLKIPAILIAI